MNKNPSKSGFWLMKYFYGFIFIFLSFHAVSQGEANNWYFGINAGITFNTKPPTTLTNGKLITNEGCATISDPMGNLLFYTDGIKVWDSKHNVTPNGSGLKGNSSSTQSAIVVPFPFNSKKYYIFTVDEEVGKDGLQYSIFDMALNSGTGDIVSTQKNLKLLYPTCEKITAIQHSNGIDYWVVTHKFNCDTIYSWLITSTGIDKVPVKCITGVIINSSVANSIGNLKISPTGKKICYANERLNNFCIGDFNTSTGIVSNIWSLSIKWAYGVEFSPLGNYVYISSTTDKSLYQFDTRAKTKSDFLNSKIIIDNNKKEYGSLQLGPDKKIYACRVGNAFVDVIFAPDSAGKNCRLKLDYINLSGRSGYLGLPAFIQSYFNSEFVYGGNCFGDTVWFLLTNSNKFDSIQWEFGDASSGMKNRAKGFKVFHLFTDTGHFKVQSIRFSGKFTDTTFLDIFQNVPKFTFGRDTFVCEKQSITLGYFKESYDKYEWSDKSTNATLTTNVPGIFSLKVKDKNGCYKSDTINVSIMKLPIVNLGMDSILCNDSTSILLDAKNQLPNTKYKWGTSDTTQTYIALKFGIYWVKVSNFCGSKSDTIEFRFLPHPKIALPADTIFCDSVDIELNAAINDPDAYYIWLSGETTPVIKVIKQGMYKVKVQNYCGEIADSISIGLYKTPDPVIGPDQIFCDKMLSISRTIKINRNLDTYQWSTGGKDTTETFRNPGKYWVKVKNRCGEGSDTVNFILSLSPKVDLGKDTTLCGNFKLLLNAGNPGMLYYWNPTGEQTQTIAATKQTTYTVTVTNNDGCSGIDKLVIDDSCISDFWFPDSFTPNGDQLNETFKPTLINFENYEMRIFNRWGELLYKTYDYNQGWDGTYMGRICQSGVYFFVSNFKSTENNSKQLIKGTITLVK